MARRRKGRGWWGDKYRHSLAAKKGWKKRRKGWKKRRKGWKKRRNVKKTVRVGLFKPAKHEDIAEIVSFKDPKTAGRSANILLAELQYTKDRKRALTIARALQYAANRSKASIKRKNLSEKEREEMRLVSKIYSNAANLGWRIYRKRFEASKSA